MPNISFDRHRFPPDIIRHAIWLYVRASTGDNERAPRQPIQLRPGQLDLLQLPQTVRTEGFQALLLPGGRGSSDPSGPPAVGQISSMKHSLQRGFFGLHHSRPIWNAGRSTRPGYSGFRSRARYMVYSFDACLGMSPNLWNTRRTWRSGEISIEKWSLTGTLNSRTRIFAAIVAIFGPMPSNEFIAFLPSVDRAWRPFAC